LRNPQNPQNPQNPHFRFFGDFSFLRNCQYCQYYQYYHFLKRDDIPGVSENLSFYVQAWFGGVTLRTFFWLAGNAGIGNGSDTEELEESEPPMPTFPFGRNAQSAQSAQSAQVHKSAHFSVLLQKVMEVAGDDEVG
jgi:hypothetical protein